MERRGFKFKNEVDQKSRAEINAEVYTEAELEELERYKQKDLVKQFGNNIEGL